MEQNNEQKLKKLIQSVELDEPTADFTAILMQKIASQETIITNPALDSLLEIYLIEAPSVDFTQKVMMDIENLDRKLVYEPIISKKMWYAIGIAAALIMALVSFFGRSVQMSNKPLPLATPINQITGKIIVQINALPTLVLACLFAVSSLVLLDYFLSNRKNYQA